MQIVPTPVGVNRVERERVRRVDDCPHARGGEPSYAERVRAQQLLSPRPWG